MGLGGTAKKLQKVIDAAEQLYSKMNEVIDRLNGLEEEVEHTSSQVDQLEHDVAKQHALLEALAEQEGVDVESVLADADLPPDPAAGDGDGTEVEVTEDGA
jgi:predicted nuclease with TOPRIM domain